MLTWKGPKLVPELCSVHPLQLSAWCARQFFLTLMYRLEVHSRARRHTPLAQACCAALPVHAQESGLS